MAEFSVGIMVRILVHPYVGVICEVEDYQCSDEGEESFLTRLGWFKSYQIDFKE